jgi:hypothetical protein
MNAAITNEVQQSPLTFLLWGVMIYPLSQKTKVWVRSQCSKGKKLPLPLTVFLCPKFSINTGKIRVQFLMVDCFRESLIGFARSFAGTSNLIQSTAQCFEANGGGYSLLTKDTATMNTSNNQAQTEQTQTKPTIDVLSYRLSYKHDDITSENDFINTFDTMTNRAISLLEIMAGYMTKTSQSKDEWIDTDSMYYSLQTAINEIKDIKAVTSAYVEANSKA